MACPDWHIHVCTFFVFLPELHSTYMSWQFYPLENAKNQKSNLEKKFKEVILPDALSALAWLSGDTGASLAKLFDLNAPAAMKRGAPIPSHGALVPYSWIWAHPIRRQADSLPQHQQASGINAGVMLLKPSKASWMGVE